MTLPRGASLTELMKELVTLEETVHEDLRVYEWRPGQIETPALYNVITDGNTEVISTRPLIRDGVTIGPRVVVRANEERWERLAEYADAFREIMDVPLMDRPPLNGAAYRAERLGLRNIVDEWDDIPYLGIEFPILFQLDRKG